VDNVVTSFDKPEELFHYFSASRTLMSAVGFNLRSWRSSYSPLNESAGEHSVLDTSEHPRVLGLLWNPVEDTLTFSEFKESIGPITKRIICSRIAQIYDLLGILGPVVIRAKIFLQQLWKLHVNWDTILPENLQNEWLTLERDLNIATTLKFARRLFHQKMDMNLAAIHVFVDASPQAYSAVIYLVYGSEVSLILAKNKVAPIKTLTLPKLELMAAVLGARLYNSVKDIFFRSHCIFMVRQSNCVIMVGNNKETRSVYAQSYKRNVKPGIGRPILILPD